MQVIADSTVRFDCVIKEYIYRKCIPYICLIVSGFNEPMNIKSEWRLVEIYELVTDAALLIHMPLG